MTTDSGLTLLDEKIPGVNDDPTAIGFEASPTMGVEFVRTSKLRFFFETKYMALLSAKGDFGHGPFAAVGMAFY